MRWTFALIQKRKAIICQTISLPLRGLLYEVNHTVFLSNLTVFSHHKERVDICDDLNASAADFCPVFKQYLLKKAVQRAYFQPL